MISDTSSNLIISSLEDSIEQLQKQVHRLSQSTPSRTDTQSTPQSYEQTSQSQKPQFAFHSVEPQKIKPRQNTETGSGSTAQGKQEAASNRTAASSSQLSFEDIMARSRAQGESLNQLFGPMQARSAGHPPRREPEQEEVNSNRMQDAAQVEEENEQEPLSSQEAQTAPIGENVGNMNNYLQDAWQERLSQMGHGPNSGSPYAKLRTGKLKELPSDMTGSAPGSSGYQ